MRRTGSKDPRIADPLFAGSNPAPGSIVLSHKTCFGTGMLKVEGGGDRRTKVFNSVFMLNTYGDRFASTACIFPRSENAPVAGLAPNVLVSLNNMTVICYKSSTYDRKTLRHFCADGAIFVQKILFL